MFNFIASYMLTFFLGYVYKKRYIDDKYRDEKLRLDKIIFIAAILGIPIRMIFTYMELGGFLNMGRDLVIQYLRLIQGAAIYIWCVDYISYDSWNNVSEKTKRFIEAFAGITYHIYIVHEFFTCSIFTDLIPDCSLIFKVICVWISIAISTFVLVYLEKIFNKCLSGIMRIKQDT